MKPDKIAIALDNLSLEMMEVALVMAQEGGEMAKRGFVLSESAEMVRGWMYWDRQGKLKAIRHPINGYRLYERTALQEFLFKLQRNETID